MQVEKLVYSILLNAIAEMGIHCHKQYHFVFASTKFIRNIMFQVPDKQTNIFCFILK